MFVLSTVGLARAETLTHARVGFTAERILFLDGHRYVGRMWYMPGEERQEQPLKGFNPIFILFEKSTVADILLPQLHTVAELPLPRGFSLLRDPAHMGRPIAHEEVDGMATTVYGVDRASPVGRARGRLWLSVEGIPLKAEGRFESPGGKITRIRWLLRKVRIGPQAASLFTVPKGFARLTPQALAPLFGLRPVKRARPPAAR
jgi:hypothetical protein